MAAGVFGHKLNNKRYKRYFLRLIGIENTTIIKDGGEVKVAEMETKLTATV